MNIYIYILLVYTLLLLKKKNEMESFRSPSLKKFELGSNIGR